MRRDRDSDRFADMPPELRVAYQKEVLGIEPPTMVEKIRSFWNKSEIFVIRLTEVNVNLLKIGEQKGSARFC